MANALQNALLKQIRELRRRVQAGPVGSFFSWWIEELKLALPEPWREKLTHASRRLTVLLRDEAMELAVDENRSLRSVGRLALTAEPSLQRQQVEDLKRENDLEEAPVYLLLDAEKVLSREVSLPLATESNLAQVLSFEMDRQTPFKASAVYFDWEVLERGGSAGKLHLLMHVVPRAEIDKAIEKLSGRGVQLSGVDIRKGERTLGLNLLPEQQRYRIVNTRTRVNWGLGAAVAVLLVLAMALSLSLRQHQVNQLESAIADVRGEAMQVDRIRKQIVSAAEAAGFLATRRAEVPLAVELLDDVTRLLPDDTYLDRLVINPSSIQLQGKSANAQQLIEKVNESPYLDAASFRGSTRLDVRSGLEIFEINAQVSVPGGDDDAGS